MKEVEVTAICGACGSSLSLSGNVCPVCNTSYPRGEEIACKLCYLPNYCFHFPSTGKSLLFCSNPDCAGWNIYHSGGMTYIAHEKSVKFIQYRVPKKLFGLIGNHQIEIVEDYQVVHSFVKRIILRHPCIDSKTRFK